MEPIRKGRRDKKKQKTINYLANKGFELDLILETVGELEMKDH